MEGKPDWLSGFPVQIYCNRGMIDVCGINYYTLEQTMGIVEVLKREKPKDFQVLLAWLADGEKYNGLYLLGV